MEIGFGTWISQQSKLEDRYNSIKAAIDLGCVMFDTAQNYGTEAILAKAIKESGKPRSSFYITTKVSHPESLEYYRDVAQRFGGYVDLLLLHTPTIFSSNAKAFMAQFKAAWKTLDDAKKAGYIRHAGVSNFYFNHLTAALSVVRLEKLTPIEANQLEVHYGTFDKDLHNLCAENNVSIIAHTPLGGLIAKDVGSSLEDGKIGARAKQLQTNVYGYILAVMVYMGIFPIFSSYSPSHIKSNLEVSFIVRYLAPEDIDLVFGKAMTFGMVDLSMASQDHNSRLGHPNTW